MTQKLFALSLGIAGVFLSLHAARAEGHPSCGRHRSVVGLLAETYGESRRSVAAAGEGSVEVFASEQTGTWTITVTRPDGTTCLVASGDGYETVEPSVSVAGTDI